ncbi:hypothetical protein VV424_001816 [Cronobacter sakazakii]|nr:hypothetical protein [Cronobacter sakazakii]
MNRTQFDGESGSPKAKTRLVGGFFKLVVPGPDKNAGSVFAQRIALPAGRVAGMRRVNRTQFDEESGSPKAKARLMGGFFKLVVPGPDKNAGSVFAQRIALPAGRVAGMRRVNRTQFDGESGSPKAKTRLVDGFSKLVVPGLGIEPRIRCHSNEITE